MKHYEDCEQLFITVGKCYLIEALLEFFQIVNENHKPTANEPHSVNILNGDYQRSYLTSTLDKFLDEYIFNDEDKESCPTAPTDGVWCYAINLIKSYILLADIKDAVPTGNGEHFTTLGKQLLTHFFSTPGFNEFLIEMWVSMHKGSSHTHKSLTNDEMLVLRDLRALRFFRKEDGRSFESFREISQNLTHLLDRVKFSEWTD